NENPTTVIAIVKKIYNLIGKKPSYKILNKAKYEIKHQYLCSEKSRKVLGWNTDYTLSAGLKKTMEWYDTKRG
ncbi:MAG: sugar dehydratase, partial [Candidatus Omnitrophota bacterium]